MPDFPSSLGSPRHSGPPALLTAVFVNVETVDCFIDSISFTNESLSTVKVTMEDLQPANRAIIKDREIGPGEQLVVSLFNRYSPGGFRWKADIAGVLNAWARYYVR